MDTLRNNADTPPDRLNEDWRFGRPHVHADALLRLLSEQAGDAGRLAPEAADTPGVQILPPAAPEAASYDSIGSDYLVRRMLAKPVRQLSLRLSGAQGSPEEPLTILCEAQGFFLSCLNVVVEPGAQAHVLERHVHHGDSVSLCLRRYTLLPGASLSLELREEGSGDSRAMNISTLSCLGGSRLRHISSCSGHVWAREETTATLSAQEGEAPELLLLSANRLQGHQTLDQRTVQLHTTPGAKSRLLYKNVLDDKATAVFGGNIRVEAGAHDTDAYLSNLNMMLSEHATVHSLPGLEILADRVRCSHGSATAPMDSEQLFYLLSRGVDEATARSLLAEGFLRDVWEQFRTPGE